MPDSGIGVGSDACFDPARCDTEKYVADVNAAGLCGKSDWRLPSKRELESLLYFGGGNAFNRHIDPDYFPTLSNFGDKPTFSASTVSHSKLDYSFTISSVTGSKAWQVTFAAGAALTVEKISSEMGGVMLVRGAPF